jgi:hypothetical protein
MLVLHVHVLVTHLLRFTGDDAFLVPGASGDDDQ